MKIKPYRIIIIFFIGMIFIGTALLSLPGTSFVKINLLDKLFTITSAVCVTGLTVVDTGSTFTTLGKGIILLCIQIGGLGYMVLGSLIIKFFGRPLEQKSVVSESLSLGKLTTYKQITSIVKQVIIFTVIFELIGSILLGIRFYTLKYGSFTKSIFLGIFHSVSAFCNAGFSLFPNSMEQFRGDNLVNIVVPLLIICGGLGFIVWVNIVQKIMEGKNFLLHSKIVILTTGVLIFLTAGSILLLNQQNASFLNLSLKERLFVTWFQSVTPRTAGFNTFPIKNFSELTILLIMCLMFIGASPGGTAGGIKTTTLFILVWFIYSFLRGEKDIAVFNRRIKVDTVIKSFVIFLLSIAVVFVISCSIHLSSQLHFKKCLFETISAFGTVGLSLGITSTLDNFSKILLIITMLLGRVGTLTLLTALFSKEPKEVKFIEEEVAVG